MGDARDLHWTWHTWRDLDADTLHAIFRLRADIFVVEQNCAYPDIDGLDPRCEHLCGIDDRGQLLAYARLLPPGLKYAEPAIGRVVVAASARKRGLARHLMNASIRRCRERFPDEPILVQAQQYLQHFYASLGFAPIGEVYLEDGIPHVDMRLDRMS